MGNYVIFWDIYTSQTYLSLQAFNIFFANEIIQNPIFLFAMEK